MQFDKPKDRICPICSNQAAPRLTKGYIQYYQCVNCKTLFSDPLDNSNMIGGEYEEERNSQQNYLRIQRVNDFVRRFKKEDVNILDFGCGHGMLIADLKKEGYVNVDGYDAYSEEYSKLPEKNKYHVITAVEVIEHTSSPFIEIDVIYRSLTPGGVVMIETSFVDIAQQEEIELEDFFYIAPQNGHSTIFSHHGLDLLMCLKGLIPCAHPNRNVRLYQKPYSK